MRGSGRRYLVSGALAGAVNGLFGGGGGSVRPACTTARRWFWSTRAALRGLTSSP